MWGRGLVVVGGVVLRSFLYRVLRGRVGSIGAAPVAQSKKGPSLRPGTHAAPAGAKGWLRVSIHQIASLSLRAISTLAIAEPRRRPWRSRIRVTIGW